MCLLTPLQRKRRLHMKTLAYIPLHYGAEYLDAVIRSIDNHVDKILILYTDVPSYGQNAGLRNPENRAQLKEIASKASKKIQWIEINATQENHHRKTVFGYSKGYDLIMAVDSDEVWEDVEESKKAAFETGCKTVNVGGDCWWHFWRSFNECHRDGFYPTRFHVVNGKEESTIIHVGKIYHMGYAQSESITRYKISCHGHKDILNTWLKDKWINYQKGKTTHLHPDSQTVWIETEPFDKTTLPQILKDHPNFNKERI